MLKIAICDDDLLFRHQAQEAVKNILQNNHVEHSLSLFQDGNKLLDAGFFDIIFLDIKMEGPSGIETAEKLRLLNNNSRIIFLTSYKQYVFSAFDVFASHYLLKPLDTQKLEKVLIKIIHNLTAVNESCCTFKCGAQIHRIPFLQIKFVEVYGRKISLHTNQEVFTFNGRLDELAESFPNCFFRCHKSYLVNLALVTRYDRETASLISGESIPIARRKTAEFGTAFLAFLREEGFSVLLPLNRL